MPAMADGEIVTGGPGGIEHSCFISYKRPFKSKNLRPDQEKALQNHLWMQIAKAVERRLLQVSDVEWPPFRDEGIEPGDALQPELSRKLCRSACMVAILTPAYFESSWCVGEWEAMKRLEEKRTRRDLIIPLVFRGDLDVMKEKCEGRKFWDLRAIIKPFQDLDTKTARAEIERIANKISTEVKAMPPQYDCGTDFRIKLGPVSSIPDPNPMAG
jgi:hypothetical protein